MPHIRNILIVENDTVWIKTLQYYFQDYNVRFFSVATVKDGKVISGGDYMDAGGLMNSLKEIEVVEEAAE